MNYMIWDKISQINGTDAEVILQDRNFANKTAIFIVKNDVPFTHAFIEDLKIKYGMTSNTNEDIAQSFLERTIESQSGIQQDRLSLEEAEKKISILNEQNSKLLLDKAKNEIQINTLNKNLANVTLEIAKTKGGM